ncbi:hypothetical protein NL676_034379 [Syzygium grande]|nr:hypothetical protein NL676_034379 [Syzygium grande]
MPMRTNTGATSRRHRSLATDRHGLSGFGRVRVRHRPRRDPCKSAPTHSVPPPLPPLPLARAPAWSDFAFEPFPFQHLGHRRLIEARIRDRNREAKASL